MKSSPQSTYIYMVLTHGTYKNITKPSDEKQNILKNHMFIKFPMKRKYDMGNSFVIIILMYRYFLLWITTNIIDT